MLLFDVDGDNGAIFSECRCYRYKLWRIWDTSLPLMNWIMLNPSTADEKTNDPTIERQQRRATMLGFGGLVVTNLFGFRATEPKAMKASADPVGPFNDIHIVGAAQKANLIMCGWGNHGSHLGRSRHVRKLLTEFELHCLRVSGTGEPCHPLYLGYDLRPIRLEKTNG